MVIVEDSVTILSMVKGQKRQSVRAQTTKVWRRMYLREWREFRGLSVEALAAKSGVSAGLISLIENRKSAGSPGTLDKLAAVLDCEVGELLDIKPEPGGRLARFWISDQDRPIIDEILAARSRIKGK